MTVNNKSPRKRTSSPAKPRITTLRRAVVWLVVGGAVAFQVTSCGGKLPDLPALSTVSKNTPESARESRQQVPSGATIFRECPQFFAAGKSPIVPQAPLLRVGTCI